MLSNQIFLKVIDGILHEIPHYKYHIGLPMWSIISSRHCEVLVKVDDVCVFEFRA